MKIQLPSAARPHLKYYVFTSNQALGWEEIKENLPNTPFFHSSTMYRKTAFEKVGGYPNMRMAQDCVLFNKMARVGELRNLPNILIKYRLCPTAVTTKSSKKDSKIIENIILDAVNDKITNEQINLLKSTTLNKSSKSKNAIYYHHLAKKYLWNNYQPKLARKNLIKSLKIKFNKLSVFYYFVSFLPDKLIRKLYKKLK